MRKGKDPNLEIETMKREGEKTHREEDIPVLEIDPDFIGIVDHKLGIEMIQEIIEEEVHPRIKIEEIIGISPGRRAKKSLRNVLPADVRSV